MCILTINNFLSNFYVVLMNAIANLQPFLITIYYFFFPHYFRQDFWFRWSIL